MAWWKKALGIGMAVGGALSANPALVAGGVSMVAGDLAADAQKKAEKQQLEASDKALKLQQDTHAQTQASLQPYSGTGGAAIQTLGHMLGLTPTAAAAGSAPGMAAAPPLDPAAAATTRADTGRAAQPRGGGLTAPTEQTRSGYAGTTMQDFAGGVVPLRAPDGEVQLVPRAQVPHYVQLGATELGGVA